MYGSYLTLKLICLYFIIAIIMGHSIRCLGRFTSSLYSLLLCCNYVIDIGADFQLSH